MPNTAIETHNTESHDEIESPSLLIEPEGCQEPSPGFFCGAPVEDGELFCAEHRERTDPDLDRDLRLGL